MRTINQLLNLYKLVLSGETVEYAGSIISSDGTFWFIDGRPVDSIDNKLKIFDYIIEKCEIVKRIVEVLGLSIADFYNNYCIVFDSLDNMILLVLNNKDYLNLIYVVSNLVTVEVIDKVNGFMKYDLFDFKNQIVKRKTMNGVLSDFSIKRIRELDNINNRTITQNFYYDIYFNGMSSYDDLVNSSLYTCGISEYQKSLFMK